MTAVDWIALAVLIASLVTGLVRGFVREAFSLAAWVAAFIAARSLSKPLAHWIPGIGQEGLRQAAAAVIVFLLVLVLAHLLALLLGQLLKAAGLGGLNHFLGLFFGAVRAAIILVLLTLVAGLTALPRTAAWQSSLVARPMVKASQYVIPWLPKDLAAMIRFS